MATLKNNPDNLAVGAILCKKTKDIHTLVNIPYKKKQITANTLGLLYNIYPAIMRLTKPPAMYCKVKGKKCHPIFSNPP